MILKCAYCEYNDGQIQNLAELQPSGIISVRRWFNPHTQKQDNTLIVGDNFKLLCGRCQTMAFQRQLEVFTIGTLQITYAQFSLIGSV